MLLPCCYCVVRPPPQQWKWSKTLEKPWVNLNCNSIDLIFEKIQCKKIQFYSIHIKLCMKFRSNGVFEESLGYGQRQSNARSVLWNRISVRCAFQQPLVIAQHFAPVHPSLISFNELETPYSVRIFLNWGILQGIMHDLRYIKTFASYTSTLPMLRASGRLSALNTRTSKGLFTPSESKKRSKNNQKRSKNNRKTSEKFFTFSFAFTQCELALKLRSQQTETKVWMNFIWSQVASSFAFNSVWTYANPDRLASKNGI